jgi:hypothetical protein
MNLRPQDAELARDWFSSHVASLVTFKDDISREIIRLVWAKLGTGINRIDYLLYGNVLFVCGDLGEAVYQWSQPISLEFLADCDLDYFGSKCRASDSEPRGKSWNPDRVKDWIEQELVQWAADNPFINDDTGEETPRTPLTYEQCQKLMWDVECIQLGEVSGSAGAWAQFVYESDGLIVTDPFDGGEDTLSRSSYPHQPFEPCDQARIGYEWSIRTRGHLLGLKLAWEQISKKGDA